MFTGVVRIRNDKEVRDLEVNSLEDEIKGYEARCSQHL